jgi:hypothetical protein
MELKAKVAQVESEISEKFEDDFPPPPFGGDDPDKGNG